ncbi:MAG: transporter substrate-binding domain-containing protein [Gammaproteobacteria bacterium]|nr:transporter substrate-binding domain-containing protein [Gammaproteobacteria bacterium]MXY63654.1 transporter substrate-binding domain-containing protein [Gammaproteobacteria bacterium]MYG65484.1 transporter substrate-binding domain-containing protein [Gammaproteobacteria bacterium]
MIPRKLVALATGLAALLLSTATLAQDQSILNKVLDSGTLRVGTTGDFNPMSFKDPETKEYMGHQIDAAKQLATDMGVEVEFVPTDWKTLINGVVAGKYDIVMTGTSMTVTRAKAAGYTIPWGRTGYLPLTRGEIADRFKSWDDINQPDVTVGYNLGTSFADFVKLRLPNAKVKEVESPARDWQELLAGRVDVTVSSILEAGKLSSTHETLAIPFQKVANSLPLSFIAPQSDHVWLGFLNNWMRIKHEGGYFKSLNEKWGIQGQD